MNFRTGSIPFRNTYLQSLESVRRGEIENAWMARPTLVRTNRRLSLEELARYTILTQGSKSGSGPYVGKWLKSEASSCHGCSPATVSSLCSG